jgi:hypothetical protein
MVSLGPLVAAQQKLLTPGCNQFLAPPICNLTSLEWADLNPWTHRVIKLEVSSDSGARLDESIAGPQHRFI